MDTAALKSLTKIDMATNFIEIPDVLCSVNIATLKQLITMDTSCIDALNFHEREIQA